MTGTLPPSQAIAKVWRFVRIYGPGRTWFKVAARLRLPMSAGSLRLRRSTPDIGLVGCGQFAFATIGYFLSRRFGARIAACHDIDPARAQSLARALRVGAVCDSAAAVAAVPGLRTLYVASNHASHAEYAGMALARGLDVVVEKPVAVTEGQLAALVAAVRTSKGRVFAGYNRPFAGATRALRRLVTIEAEGGMTLQCFVTGHRLAAEHWYRRPDEGTRICGNVGHWLDLAVHLWSWRGLPERLDISLTWADDAEPDDNLHVAIRSDRGDLFGVTLTSRSEPFEGIRETISFQHGETIAQIDDFRRLDVWSGPRVVRRRFWPKDVGHRAAILQPFAAPGGFARDWNEVVSSTLLMLHIAQMVRTGQRHSSFSFGESRRRLDANISAATEAASERP